MYWTAVKWGLVTLFEIIKEKKGDAIKTGGIIFLASLCYGSLLHENQKSLVELERVRLADKQENYEWRKEHEAFGKEYREWNRSELKDIKAGQVTTNENIGVTNTNLVNFARDLIPNPRHSVKETRKIKYINKQEPVVPEKQGE